MMFPYIIVASKTNVKGILDFDFRDVEFLTAIHNHNIFVPILVKTWQLSDVSKPPNTR